MGLGPGPVLSSSFWLGELEGKICRGVSGLTRLLTLVISKSPFLEGQWLSRGFSESLFSKEMKKECRHELESVSGRRPGLSLIKSGDRCGEGHR